MLHKNILWQIESVWTQAFSLTDTALDFSGLQGKYDSPANRLNCDPNLKMVDYLRPEWGSEAVFLDENNIGHSGIKEYQLWFENGSRPVYLFDNHQWALLAFADMHQITGAPQNIVHIDAHRDDAVFPGNVDATANILELIRHCRVSDYLDAAKRAGLIENVAAVTQSWEFESFMVPDGPFILNLDLDIYGPEGKAVSLATKTAVIAKAWTRANAVIMATSPGFMDQIDAENLIRIFTRR